MPRFFTEHGDENEIVITGEDARHIGRSLRMRVGEALTVCAEGIDYDCEITRITDSEVYLHPLHIAPCAAEPTVRVTLYMAIPKQDKLAEIVQKSVELGVSEIVPVLTARCVARPTKADFEKKRDRLQKIAHAAAKQSGRGIIPEVAPLHTWQEALRSMQAQDIAV
ncbi:MAG: 16S rRNA (uracil(1498)-N(3))-methyltransferase, partial [Oscillospiraceae bacterium]|nr:16S rRNA (uracil(1498)-N(3))-methyltransferase [Oscillospiraceae bacterium]